MLGTIAVVAVGSVVLSTYGKKLYAAVKAKITGIPAVVAAKGTAFARLADQEGKIIALKAASAVKASEAKAAHAALDEFDKLIG